MNLRYSRNDTFLHPCLKYYMFGLVMRPNLNFNTLLVPQFTAPETRHNVRKPAQTEKPRDGELRNGKQRESAKTENFHEFGRWVGFGMALGTREQTLGKQVAVQATPFPELTVDPPGNQSRDPRLQCRKTRLLAKFRRVP